MKINIPHPCHEDWSKMKIGVDSRFCNHCTKHVIDFTNKSREEILTYLLENYDKKVCGRMRTSQLDFHHEEFMITIKALSNKHRNSNLGFYLLSLGALMMSCNNIEPSTANMIHKTFSNNIIISTNSDTVNVITEEPFKQCTKSEIENIDVTMGIMIPEDVTELQGDITLVENTEPYFITDMMPEYPGGMDSLTSFLHQNIQYPEVDKKNKIEGTVYARFIIQKSGEIKNIEILRTPSENMSKEVIRVIEKMPEWIPGETNNRKVDVSFVLPVKFTL